jgi:Putative Flp pilus-assembly TadE/G-like
MLMTRRRLADERGGILVMSAVMIPVFLLLTALVLDVGNWFTHKRQLQNRADAAAFAAGVEYARNWRACVQNGDVALKLTTAKAIADAARQYAGDPEAADYTGGTLPATLHNPEIANQANVDVVINSSDPEYDDDTDHSDLAGDAASPCVQHSADDISSAGHWTDVRVKERDLPSIFGAVGLPLSRNGARARVEIRPAISGHRFLPLAVPNNIITKVQVRYYNECNGAEITSARHDLAPLPAADQSAFAAAGGGQLWGLPSAGNPAVGDSNLSFGLALPSYSASCGDYVPVGVEVRLASRDDIDLNQSCAALLAARYADCFHRLSQIRVWNDGNADSQPRIPRITLSGGCGAPGDGYFSRLPVAAVNCKYDATVEVNWGTRSTGTTDVPANFTVSANGTNVPLVTWVPGGVSTYATSGGAITGNPGANPVTITAHWEDQTNGHSWDGNNCKPGNTPCKVTVNDGHRNFVGTTGTAGAVALVRTSQSPFVAGLPGSPFDNHRSGGGPADCSNSDTCFVYPTVGTTSVLKTGVFTTLRLDDPQANQTLQCDPNFAQGQEFSAFRYGCQPWYGANQWGSPWWIGSPGSMHCPDGGQWFSYSDLGNGFGVNSSNNPWECVLTAPGLSTGQIGDDIAVATQNCDNINNNSCQTFDCNYDGNYDGKTGSPVQPWIVKSDSRYPRVVNLFIVPYQASKGLTGSGDTIPVLGFASFYVMNWTGANNNQSDPCPDRTWGNITVPDPPKGAITGVFIETVDYEPGPVDPNATCVEGQLTPCRVTLVR